MSFCEMQKVILSFIFLWGKFQNDDREEGPCFTKTIISMHDNQQNIATNKDYKQEAATVCYQQRLR